ncbi:MAG: RNase adaptor protein RapZ [Alphaproteobacteria bacterium 41-28]|nr:MAG: RNase adaptor protein RapZ [Alphaproteobacteria bacterium 41-28]
MNLIQTDPSKKLVLLITGMSGSGRSFALKTLEDMGYETIDNLPLSFLEPVALARHEDSRPLAISVDVRTRDFSSNQFLQQMEKLSKSSFLNTQLIFFECDDEVLARRYNETRRLHPLGQERRVIDGIRLERHLISPLRERADFVIDTSILLTSDLRGHLRRIFLPKKTPSLSIFITSFSFRHGLPREADMVFDARLLKNPFHVKELSSLSGEDPEVGSYIQEDKSYSSYIKSLKSILSMSIPRFEEEGRGYLTLAIGCTGGQHRSVFIAKILKEWLQETKKQVKLRHRDLKKRQMR